MSNKKAIIWLSKFMSPLKYKENINRVCSPIKTLIIQRVAFKNSPGWFIRFKRTDLKFSKRDDVCHAKIQWFLVYANFLSTIRQVLTKTAWAFKELMPSQLTEMTKRHLGEMAINLLWEKANSSLLLVDRVCYSRYSPVLILKVTDNLFTRPFQWPMNESYANFANKKRTVLGKLHFRFEC